MLAAIAIGPWVLAACAAGVLASQRHGEPARAARSTPVSRRGWGAWSVVSHVCACLSAVHMLGWAVGVAVWLSALCVFGALATAVLSANPRVAIPMAGLATVAGLAAAGGIAWA